MKDIHSVLEVTVFDEDRDKKAEFLGKVAIPILRVSFYPIYIYDKCPDHYIIQIININN